MRCLLDKVTARFMVQGILKLAEERTVADDEMVALDLWSRFHEMIQRRLNQMRADFQGPSTRISLPQVLRPDQIP